ncbi:ROK family protein [Octadecabacter sp. 1_MG-2023]|uniref:glucokinase n=1 Tax=unclassified Octadecabacter TaxID=196158 RepID=UPI001C098E24|nr:MULTISPECIES: ROK family protein [unclassified Octadecabacter]MBU2993380.1 glucokinase [Octadecabacter sp. B2R22]MDO6733164.1 ROK family protein [Octadecabacter sp. 1_MG-2023]
MKYPANTLSLVADIGGTNTRCALADGPRVLQDTVRRYSNADFDGLETVLRQYLADAGDVDPAAACVAVAGPVHNGVATMTNLDWTIDRDTLARATRAETVAILNDLQAQGHALADLDSSALRPIIDRTDETLNSHAARLVVGVGTGFNATPVFDTDMGRFVPPSEAGHANLPIRTEQDLRLAQYVSKAHGFPAVEDVVSGRGLERVYSFLGHDADDPHEARAQDIMAACAKGNDPRARDAVALFIRFLGTVCGNLALIQLPFGGVYLVGGVARAMAPYMAEFGFGDAFHDKGRFAGFMTNFSVHVVEDDYAALSGCASHIQALMVA